MSVRDREQLAWTAEQVVEEGNGRGAVLGAFDGEAEGEGYQSVDLG
ncbi:MAG: hypothetical protein H0T43_03040 [Solirubrobacterales bacterium]|nr:hypothetical protein [Solirubrobacterales bacterium]